MSLRSGSLLDQFSPPQETNNLYQRFWMSRYSWVMTQANQRNNREPTTNTVKYKRWHRYAPVSLSTCPISWRTNSCPSAMGPPPPNTAWIKSTSSGTAIISETWPCPQKNLLGPPESWLQKTVTLPVCQRQIMCRGWWSASLKWKMKNRNSSSRFHFLGTWREVRESISGIASTYRRCLPSAAKNL